MKPAFLFLAFSLFYRNSYSQSDTIWYNKQWEEVSTYSEMEYYRIPVVKLGSVYILKDFYKNGNLKTHLTALDPGFEKLIGNIVYYYPNKDTQALYNFDILGNYISHKTYYENNKLQEVYMPGKNPGEFEVQTYFYNGKLKFKSYIINNTFQNQSHYFYRNESIKKKVFYNNSGSIDSFISYYSNGNVKARVLYDEESKVKEFYNYNPDKSNLLTFKKSGINFSEYNSSIKIDDVLWERTMKRDGGVEYWKLFKNKNLIFSYQFKGKEKLGEWIVYYEKTGKPFEKFIYTNNVKINLSSEVNSEKLISDNDYIKISIIPYYFNDEYIKGSSKYIQYNQFGTVYASSDITEGSYKYLFSENHWNDNPFLDLNHKVKELNKMLIVDEIDTTTTTSFLIKNKNEKLYESSFDGIKMNVAYIEESCNTDVLFNNYKVNSNEIIISIFKKENKIAGLAMGIGETVMYKLEKGILEKDELFNHLFYTFKDLIPIKEILEKGLSLDYFLYIKSHDNASDTIDYNNEYFNRKAALKVTVNFQQAVIYEPYVTISKNNIENIPNCYTFFPTYPGGEKELAMHIAANTTYPEMEKNNDLQGKVICRFEVDKKGKVINPEIIKSVSDGFDKEVLRVVTTFPKWELNQFKGKKVKILYELGIRFVIR